MKVIVCLAFLLSGLCCIRSAALPSPTPHAVILDQLGSRDPQTRLQALQEIENRRLFHPPVISALIDCLDDPVPYLQSEAMHLLIEAGKPAIPLLLTHIDADPSHIPSRLLYILARAGHREVIPLLKKNISEANIHPDTERYTLGMMGLGYVGGAEEVAFILKNRFQAFSTQLPLLHLAKRDLRMFLKGLAMVEIDDPMEVHLKKVFLDLNLKTRDILSLFYDPNPIHTAEALMLIRTLATSGVAPLIIAGLSHQDTRVIREALKNVLFFTEQSKLSRGDIQRIDALINAYPPSIRLQLREPLAWVMTAIASTRGAPFLLNILENPSSPGSLRWKILSYLAETSHPEAPKILARYLYSAEFPVPAARGLLLLKDPGLAKKLTRIIQKEVSTDTKSKLIPILGKCAPPDLSLTLLPYLTNPDLGEAVVTALFYANVPKLKEILLSYFDRDDLSKSTRRGIIHVLAEMEGEEISAHLLNYINHTDSKRREHLVAILQTLIKHRPPSLETVLTSYLFDREEDIRGLAARGLGDIKSKKSVPFLLQQLSATSENREATTLAVLAALGQIGDERAVTPILLTLHSVTHTGIIESALEALKMLKSPRAVPYIRPFLNHDQTVVQKAAREALKASQAG